LNKLQTAAMKKQTGLSKWVPGLLMFSGYKASWLTGDFVASLSVASIALPIGIAYAGLAGLPAEVGLYTSIFPLLAYALFGSSRQLIVGPDSVLCMIIAATLAAYGSVSPEKYASLAVLLSLMVGLFCIAGGLLRLGFITNFLSQPILNGFFNGIAITVIMGQLGKLFGFKIISGGFLRQAIDFFSKLDQTNTVTLIMGVSTLLLLILLKRFAPRIPAPLIAVICGICAVYFLGLESSGTALAGSVAAGLPSFGLTMFSFEEVSLLTGAALSIAFFSYCNAMLASKGFAIKNGYEIDANQDFIALGMANVFSGFSQGFAVSASASRTAVSDSAGGKSRLTAVMASISLLVILLYFTYPLQWLPEASLAAIIITAVFGLFNFSYLKRLFKVSKREFAAAAFTSLCVITIGVLPGVLIAIGLALLRLLVRASNPKDAVLGRVAELDNYQDITEHKDAATIPGLLIYRYEASLLFFNADNLRDRIRLLVSGSELQINAVLIDASTFLTTDITGIETLGDLCNELKEKNITLYIAKGKKEFLDMLERSGIDKLIGRDNFFGSVRLGVEHYERCYRIR
jgi:high affinity sulfate transporter 1